MENKKLTNEQIVELAQRISRNAMEKIAQGKFNFDSETIDNIQDDNRKAEKQNRVMIEKWAKIVKDHTVIRLAKILYESAKDDDVNPHYVEKVLGVTEEEAMAFKDPGVTSVPQEPSGEPAPSQPEKQAQAVSSVLGKSRLVPAGRQSTGTTGDAVDGDVIEILQYSTTS